MSDKRRHWTPKQNDAAENVYLRSKVDRLNAEISTRINRLQKSHEKNTILEAQISTLRVENMGLKDAVDVMAEAMDENASKIYAGAGEDERTEDILECVELAEGYTRREFYVKIYDKPERGNT